jgi:AraC-like DNA-binding protein
MGYARLLLLCLEQQGVDVLALYGRDRMSAARGPAPSPKISAQAWDDMVAIADRCLPGLDVALAMAEFIQPMDIGPIGFLIMASHNLREAAQVMEEFSPLLNDVYRIKVELIHGRLTSMLHPVGPYRSPYLERLILGTMCWQNRCLVRNDGLIFDGHFAFPPPSEALRPRYERTFGGELRFDADLSAVLRPPGAELLPVARGDQGVQETLRTQLTAQLGKLNESSPNVCQQVESIIRTRLGRGQEVSIDNVALEMNISVRTLQARIKGFGLDFRELTDRVLYSLALDHLGHKTVSLMDVAIMLGFSSQSSFNRAFKRWANVSPGEYRRMKTRS